MSSEPAISKRVDGPNDAIASWGITVRRIGQRLGLALPDDVAADETPLAWARRNEIPNRVICEAAAETSGVPFYADPEPWQAVVGFIDRYPIAHARRHGVLAVETDADGPRLLLGDPVSESQFDTARRLLGSELGMAFAPMDVVQKMIDEVYGKRSGQAATLLETIDRGEVLSELNGLEGREDLLDSSGRAPVIKLVNLMLFEAVKTGASDIHIQPEPDRVSVRMRIDGVLFDSLTIPKHLQDEVLSRLKVQGKMNIAEKRLPQDGRATVRVGERMIDLRIASLPGSDGERIVVRLLDKSAKLYSLAEVGMDPADLADFEKLIRLEHGLILVTGPTGSGKSTTLYAALQEINTTDRNVVTLEDPIEYEIQGVSQTQINATHWPWTKT
ncbi:MAG: ATPase, T2SS/T4P/T4SS family [Planctomycetota bacterium]